MRDYIHVGYYVHGLAHKYDHAIIIKLHDCKSNFRFWHIHAYNCQLHIQLTITTTYSRGSYELLFKSMTKYVGIIDV